MSRSGCGLKRVVRCTGTGHSETGSAFTGAVGNAEFGPASVCTRGKPQLRLLEWLLSGGYLLAGSFRPAKNIRIRTGTDQGNPTV